MRGHGKAIFADLQDSSGRIQLYARLDSLGDELFEDFRRLDIGDIIGVRGLVFRTRRGEISVEVESFELLAKALRPLPEKWHGLKDVELRYRMRYLDLIANPEVKEVFVARSVANSEYARVFDGSWFLGSRDSGAQLDTGWGERQAVSNLSQCSRYAPVFAYRTGALSEAAASRRHQSCV